MNTGPREESNEYTRHSPTLSINNFKKSACRNIITENIQIIVNLPVMGKLYARVSSKSNTEMRDKRYQRGISKSLQQQHTTAPVE